MKGFSETDLRDYQRRNPTRFAAPAEDPGTAWLEHDHQVRLIDWCRHDAPVAIRAQTAKLFAIPNGGDRHPAVAAKLRAEGVVAGTPDLMLPVPIAPYAGLWIELKKFSGRTQPAQLERLEQLRQDGYHAVIAVGWQAARDVIVTYLGGGA